MGVNRKLLYWGVFFVAIGAVLVASELNWFDESAIGDALRLWPLVFVAIGIAIVLRRTQFSLAGGLLAAAVPGLVLGGLVVVGPSIAVGCGDDELPTTYTTRQGSFDGPARVDITTSCGSLSVTTGSGATWQLRAGNTDSRVPVVDASSNRLSIGDGRHRSWFRLGERDDWQLTLPTSPISQLSLVVNAGVGRVDLPGAQLDRLSVTTNAARSTVDLTDTSLGGFDGTVNAGEVSYRLPAAADFTGSIVVNAGSAKVCVPDGLGIRVSQTVVLGSADYRGLVQTGGTWQSPDYASAQHRADLTVNVNLGNIDFNPIGGCK